MRLPLSSVFPDCFAKVSCDPAEDTPAAAAWAYFKPVVFGAGLSTVCFAIDAIEGVFNGLTLAPFHPSQKPQAQRSMTRTIAYLHLVRLEWILLSVLLYGSSPTINICNLLVLLLESTCDLLARPALAGDWILVSIFSAMHAVYY